MVVSLRDNLKIIDTSDNFVSEFNANFEKAYNYTIENVSSENISMYDVLNAFAVYNDLYYSGIPVGSTFEWFLPDGVSENVNVKAVKGSLVPYRLTFDDDTQHINFLRVEKNTVIDCSNLEPNTIRLTINPTPSDATVTITVDGYNQYNFTQVENYIDVIHGTTVSYTVSKPGYATENGELTLLENNILNIALEERYKYEADLSDYIYTNIDKNVVLTQYIGNDVNVIMPDIHEV